MKISIIGTGNLGTSIAKGLLANDMFTSLYLTKKNISSLNEWQDISSVSVTNDNIKAVKNSIKEVTGLDPKCTTDGGTSDGRFIAPTGSQVVELGPGNASIHKVNESVRKDDLDELNKIYKTILIKLVSNI